jgi:hypothetical protein
MERLCAPAFAVLLLSACSATSTPSEPADAGVVRDGPSYDVPAPRPRAKRTALTPATVDQFVRWAGDQHKNPEIIEELERAQPDGIAALVDYTHRAWRFENGEHVFDPQMEPMTALSLYRHVAVAEHLARISDLIWRKVPPNTEQHIEGSLANDVIEHHAAALEVIACTQGEEAAAELTRIEASHPHPSTRTLATMARRYQNDRTKCRVDEFW